VVSPVALNQQLAELYAVQALWKVLPLSAVRLISLAAAE